MRTPWLLLCCGIIFVPLAGCDQIAQFSLTGDVGPPGWDDVLGDPVRYRESPIALADGLAEINAENSRIKVVAVHAMGFYEAGFSELHGRVEVDPSSRRLQSLSLEAPTASISVNNERMQTLVKSPDFLNVRQFPRVTFQSTQITGIPDDEQGYDVRGELTLLGVTKELEFPVSIVLSDRSIHLAMDDILIDRTQFGMDYRTDIFAKEVSLMVEIGVQAVSPGEQGGGRPQFDPQQFFSESDQDGDGKLSGDEIPQWMLERMERFDANEDGSVTRREFEEGRRQRSGEGRGRGRGRGEQAEGEASNASEDPPSEASGDGPSRP